MSSAAYAADVVVVETPEPVIVSAYDWSGLYVGVNGGYGGGDFEHPFYVDAAIPPSEDPPFPGLIGRVLDGSVDFTASGFVGGGQVGYNWQSGQFVFGAEADIQASGVKGEASANVSIPAGVLDPSQPELGASSEVGTKLDYFGTVRARIGYVPVERLLVYGTGGFAYGRTESYLKIDVDGGPSLVDESTKDTRTGWTVGGGAEYAFTDNWSLKTEYLYTDLGSEELVSGDIFGDFLSGGLESDVKFHTVRAGLNYKF